MSLPISFRNAVRKSIKILADQLIEGKATPDSQSYNKWKFSNSADFHYGHFVGMMEGNVSGMFIQFFKRNMNEEELRELTEIIEELGKPFREYLQTRFGEKT